LPHGYQRQEHLPGMVCDLAGIPQFVPAPGSFTLQPVSDLSTLKTYTEVFCAGFDLPASFIQPFHDFSAVVGFSDSLTHFLGFLGSESVATASLFLSDGIAGIYNIAVIKKARRQGLGAAITPTLLLVARALGYQIAALQASDMGFTVYQRLGFRKVGDLIHFSVDLAPN
jgi:ribosomal protein S18 acetylase RimI-like enzyme